jgi:four helix bundle protein
LAALASVGVRSAFRELRAYQLAAELSDELHVVVRRWPDLDRRSHGIQLMRAVDSIGANIAEASGRWYRTEQRRLLFIARGSLLETEQWMTRAEERGLLAKGSTEKLTEIARTLNGMIKKHGRP